MDERVDVSKPPSWKFIRRKNPREIGGFFLPKNGWRMDRKEREMDIVNLKLSEIKPYENNPRYNDDAVDKVAKSIQEFGFKVPIVVDKNGVIIARHTR